MNGDEQNILKLVGRYRLVTRGVVAEVVGSEAKADKLLGRLVKNDLLVANRRLPGNRTVYQLGRKGSAKAGLNDSRSKAHGTQAMLKHLGVLLYCYGPHNAFRLEDREFADVVPGGLPTGTYCIDKSKDHTVVLACYVPSPTASMDSVVRRLRRMHAELVSKARAKQFVLDGRLGLVVLVESPQRRRAVMDAVRRPDGQRRPLVKSIRVRVIDVPELGKYFGVASNSPKSGTSGAGLWDLLRDEEDPP